MNIFSVLYRLSQQAMWGIFCLATAFGGDLTKLKIGEPFPAFSLDQLGTPGVAIDLEQFKGQVVVIDFWASWCEPCKRVMPILDQINSKFKGKVAVVGVNVDDDEQAAIGFIQNHKVSFYLAYDQGKKLVHRINVGTMPASFVLDRRGLLQYAHWGFNTGYKSKIESEIKILLDIR